MAEFFVNFLAETTLNGAINNSVTALVINAVAASPTTPNVRIRIDDELMLVTAIASTVNYTVTRGIEGTTATSHANGASVRYVLTAAALGGQSDAAAGTPSLRSLGSTATQAAAGIHASIHHNGGADALTGQSIAGLLTSSTPQFAGLNLGGDVSLVREAANVLALQNGANPQAFRAYNTYIDVSNWEWGGMRWVSNAFRVGTSALGTGVARALYFEVAGTEFWQIAPSPAGMLSPLADNSYDLGSSGLRVRTGYFGTRVAVGVATNATGPIYVGADGGFNAVFESAATGIAARPGLSFRRAGGTQASLADAANADQIGSITFATRSTSYFDTAEIRAIVDGTFTTGQRPPSRMEFYTNIANGAQSLRLTISGEGALVMPELGADASAPATNNGAIYFKDNGSGKTQLAVRFPTGAVQILATEP